MNEIVICELYHPELHGPTHDTTYGHYLTMWTFTPLEFYAGEHNDIHKISMQFSWNSYFRRINYHERINPHPFIQNYWKAQYNMKKKRRIDIAEVVILETGEHVAILKTFWLKIFQRKWRKIFNERKRIIKKRKQLSSLLYRQYNGKFPLTCQSMP